jgi:hypothetical protein
MLSIVASLIFVGLEMRQSHRIAEAGQYQERSNSYISALCTIFAANG